MAREHPPWEVSIDGELVLVDAYKYRCEGDDYVFYDDRDFKMEVARFPRDSTGGPPKLILP